MSTESTLPALPVRQRGTLEIIDTAMKLYRRYFGVLMGWSAIVALLFVLALTVPFGALLIYPLVPGSVCCAIAAAVRGQKIGFGQVWEFTKPRYGALILITFLSGLLMIVALGVVSVVSVLISLAGTWALSSMNAPTEVTVGAALIGTIVALIVGSVLSVVAYAWLGLMPIIACLEDDKRGVAAMGRAWELMKGSWVRVLGLSTLLSIAVLAVLGIIGGTMALLGEGMGVFVDNPSESAFIGLGLTFFGFFGLFFLFWNPIQNLILAVLYLDLRVRKEALDLEWSSYASAPLPPQNAAPDLSAVELAHDVTPPELSPASMSGYAPDSFASNGEVACPPHPENLVSPPAAPPPRPPAPIHATSSENAPDIIEISPAPPEISLNKAASSFSAAPSNSAAPTQDTFDFSSSFNAGANEPTSFSPDADDAEDKRANV